jgi:hypothetical protein
MEGGGERGGEKGRGEARAGWGRGGGRGGETQARTHAHPLGAWFRTASFVSEAGWQQTSEGLKHFLFFVSK